MSFQHQARKRFGQNFLHDDNVIDRLLRAINPQPGEHLVEIGPGLGALTLPLLERARRLEAVELDRDLVGELKRRAEPVGELVIHQADALRFDFRSLRRDERPLRVVGNLPYNISTPLIFHLLEAAEVVQDMHFMLQKEVVERLAAPVGDDAYGRLSVMVQYHCKVQSLFVIPPGAFRPAPKVDSAFVRLIPHPVRPVTVRDTAALSQLVAQAFGQRRKTLRNSLKGLLSEADIAGAGVDPGARAERVDLAGFCRLADRLDELRAGGREGAPQEP